MTLVSPCRTLTIAGKSYVLDGSFGTLRAIQQAFDKDIVQVLIGVMDLRLDEVAKLIALGSGQDSDAIGQDILDSIGLSASYMILKTELYAWLTIAITPKAEREKKSAEMDELVQKARSLSPGPTISVSPSDLSDGSPPSSGEATSGN